MHNQESTKDTSNEKSPGGPFPVIEPPQGIQFPSMISEQNLSSYYTSGLSLTVAG